jgi:hypothetical protein
MIAVFGYDKSCHRIQGLDNFVQIQRVDPRLEEGSCREAILAQLREN